MRQAFNSKGWIHDSTGQFMGVALGFDFCAEHERGAKDLMRAFEVDSSQLGFDAIVAHQAPPVVRWEERRVRKPVKSTHQSYKKEVDPDKLHEAVLYIAAHTYARSQDQGLFDLATQQLGKSIDMRWHAYNPDRDDFEVTWSESEALIRVRGRENIALLAEVRDAIQKVDLVFNAPAAAGFTRRDGGLALGIASRFDEAYRAQMLEDDLAARRLTAAAQASGIEERLRAAGKAYHALSPDWLDHATEQGLKFFLNPANLRGQPPANFGWFTLDELEAWSRNEGIVLKDPQLEEAVKAAGYKSTNDFESQLLKILEAASPRIRFGMVETTWADAARTQLGFRILPVPSDMEGRFLPPGTYRALDLFDHPETYAVDQHPVVSPETVTASADLVISSKRARPRPR